MKPRYCYWSVATGEDAALLERCVRTARAAGVFKEFHVLTDRSLEGCECYDAFECDRAHGLHKLHYLKAGMTRLNFEYFVWLDPDTVFTRNPADLLGSLGRAPLHVPLELRLAEAPADTVWQGMPLQRAGALMTTLGVPGPVWLGGAGFWIVHREVIETLYELAVGYWHKAKAAGFAADVSAGLAFAMLMLGADAERHSLARQPELWAADHAGQFGGQPPPGADAWRWQHPLGGEALSVRPAVVQLPSARAPVGIASHTL